MAGSGSQVSNHFFHLASGTAHVQLLFRLCQYGTVFPSKVHVLTSVPDPYGQESKKNLYATVLLVLRDFLCMKIDVSIPVPTVR